MFLPAFLEVKSGIDKFQYRLLLVPNAVPTQQDTESPDRSQLRQIVST